MSDCRLKVHGFWCQDWRGAPITSYPSRIRTATARDLGRAASCQRCGKICHVGYSTRPETELVGVPLCSVDAIVAAARAEGRSAEKLGPPPRPRRRKCPLDGPLSD